MEQKRWVRIAVVFFALMVVLTIFSRAASSAVKAHVSVVKASRQKISHEIQLDGSVEAKNYFLQYVPAGLMAGQQVEAGDVIFTVDVQKVQEKIKAIEAELNRADQKDRLSISRSEASYQDVIINAEEEKAHAYEAYTKAVSEYQNYINTHKKSVDTKTADTDGNSGDAQTSELADSVYDASVAAELENAIEAQKSAYEAVVREQEKQVREASDAVQQTKEDLNLFAYLCGKWRRVSGGMFRCNWSDQCGSRKRDRRWDRCDAGRCCRNGAVYGGSVRRIPR